jgi:hypothetical protein
VYCDKKENSLFKRSPFGMLILHRYVIAYKGYHFSREKIRTLFFKSPNLRLPKKSHLPLKKGGVRGIIEPISLLISL